MKKQVIITAIALMSTQAFSSDLRDASFKGTSKSSDFTTKQGESTVDATLKAANFTGEQLNALISKRLASTAKSSASVGRALVQVSEVSKPVFQFTGKGLAMVFELSGKAAMTSLEGSKKLVILLDPSSKVSGRVLEYILDRMSDGSELSSDVSTKILKPLSKGTEASSELSSKLIKLFAETFKEPLDSTTNVLERISDLMSKGTTKGSELSTNVTGEKNLEAGSKITGKGISLTSKGIAAIFYFISKGTTGITQLFDMNKEEIQQAVERQDQETLAGLKEVIRDEINKSIEGGEVINQLLTDADLDAFIDLKLAGII
jgi:hypothetical protein